jgi:PKD repeat protein
VTLSITTKTSGKKYSAESVKITVSDIDASFTASTTSGTAPLTVKFTDTSGGATAWAWSIYKTDSGSKTLQKEMTDRNISYTFQNAGTYQVELIAKKGSSTSSEVKTITVSAKATTAPITVKTTATTAPTTASATIEAKAATLSNDDSLVPNPIEIIEEFIRLLKVMLVPENYNLAP